MRVGIVGAGPAGIAAGIFLTRYGFEVVVFEKDEVGGLIRNAYRVVNIPYLLPLSGEEIVETIKGRIKEFNLKSEKAEITEVAGTELNDKDGNTYHFDLILIATGTRPRRIPEFEVDKRVVYEFSKIPSETEKLVIYGGGDVAFDGALKALNKGIKEVTIFVRSKNINAVPELYKEALEKGIKIKLEEPIHCVDAGDTLKITTSKGEYFSDSLLIAIGREPEIPMIKDSTRVFIVGDAALNRRQMSIAVTHSIETCMNIVKEYKICKYFTFKERKELQLFT